MIKIVNVNSGKKAPLEEQVFAQYGAEYNCVVTKTAEELIEAGQGAQVILFTAARFTAEVFDCLPELRLLVRYGIGYDTVDLAAARERNVDVCNAPSYGAVDVAEHTFTLLLSANRKIISYDANVRAGQFGGSGEYNAFRLCGKTLGLIGFGRIARHVVKFAQGFGMEVVTYDPYIETSAVEAMEARAIGFEELLRTADFVSLHTPLNDKTYHMIGTREFTLMKPSAVLINTARGALVDENALFEALKARNIRAAGIDVYENYPRELGNPFHALDNIVLTPHIAFNTVEAVEALHEEVTEEVVRFLQGKPNLNIVNR